jgi:hypothetical protein
MSKAMARRRVYALTLLVPRRMGGGRLQANDDIVIEGLTSLRRS